MNCLRILDGLHAGARLSLPPGRHRVAAPTAESEDEADAAGGGDVVLLDWSGPALLLSVDDAGRVRAVVDGVPPNTAGHADDAEWQPLQPRRFGAVTLCLCEDAATQPDDAELLALVSFSDSSPVGLPRIGRHGPGSWSVRAGVLGAGLLVAVGAIYGRSEDAVHEPAIPRPAFGAELLTRALSTRGLDGLQVRVHRRDVVLAGLVVTPADARAVREAVAEVQRSSGVPVVEEWEVAEDIASTIETALRRPGLHAYYLGTGRFEVRGVVKNPAVVRDAGPQLRKDLGANVRSIDFVLDPKSMAVPFTSAMTADNLRYSERPDGAKVFASLSGNH